MFQLFGDGNKNKRKRARPGWTEPFCSAELRRRSPRPRSCKISHVLLVSLDLDAGNESLTSSSGTIWGFFRFCCCSFHALFNKSPFWVNLCSFTRSERARGRNGEEDPGAVCRRGEEVKMYLAYFEECDGTFLSFFSVNTGEGTKALTARAPLRSSSWKLRLASARVALSPPRPPMARAHLEKTPNFWNVEKALGRAGRGAFDELQEMRDRPRYQRQKNTPPKQDSEQTSSSVGEMWKKWWANKGWQSSDT